MIAQDKWKWFGSAGHFICGPWCRFHLCTKIGKYLISTVGEYIPPMYSGGSEKSENEWLKENPNGAEIGYKRFYETMVFKAGKPCRSEDCKCGLPEINGSDLDANGYLTAGEATKGHLAMCKKWAGKQ